MRFPAARDRRCLWLVVACLVLLSALPGVVFAQETPTPIPPQSAVVDVSGGWSQRSVTLTEPAVAPEVCDDSAEVSPEQLPLYDYVILLDVSSSMQGLRGEPPTVTYSEQLDIWGEVVQSATTFLTELDDEAAVYIIPFAGGVLNPDTGVLFDPSLQANAPEAIQVFNPFYMADPGSRQAAISRVSGLSPEYAGTHLAQSVEYALKLLAALKDDDQNPREHVQTLLIYSDGIGNGPGDPDYVGEDKGSYPTLPEILKRYLAAENYVFTKYILLSEAAETLDPALADELIGVGVSFVNGKVPEIREIRLAVQGMELGTLDVDDRAFVKLCLAQGDVGDGVALRISDSQGQLPENVTLRYVPPDDPTIRADGLGIEVGWRLVEKPGEPVDDTYYAQLIVDPVDPEVILVPGQFTLPFKVKGFPASSIAATPATPVDARRSEAGSGDSITRDVEIKLNAPLPDGASATLSLRESDAHHGIEAGFVRDGDSIAPTLALGPGDDSATLRITMPPDALIVTRDGQPRGDGTYQLDFTVEATAEGVELNGASPGEPVGLAVTQEVMVLPGGSVTGCDPDDGIGGQQANGDRSVALTRCLDVSFQIGGGAPGVRGETPLGLQLSDSAEVTVSIGERDGVDLFPNAKAGFAVPGGTYEDPARVETADLDAASGQIAVVLDVPAGDLQAMEPGAYPVVIDVIVDPRGVDIDLVGAEPNGDGSWTVPAGAVFNVVARPICEIGPVVPAPPVGGSPSEFVIGSGPGNLVTWEFEVPYTVPEGVPCGRLRASVSQLPAGSAATLVVGAREVDEVLLDRPGLKVSARVSVPVAELEQLGAGPHELAMIVLIQPGDAELGGTDVLDNGDGTFALQVPLVITLIDPVNASCDLPEFPAQRIADRGPEESVVWTSPVPCAIPESAVIRVGGQVGEGSPVASTVAIEPRKLDVAVQEATARLTANAADLRALGRGTHCIPVTVTYKLEGEGLVLSGDGINETGDGMYTGLVEACVEIGAARVVRLEAPVCEVPALRSDAEPDGAFRALCTIVHAEENGGEAILTLRRGALSEGLNVGFVGVGGEVTIRGGEPDPLQVEITGTNAAAMAEGASFGFEVQIDPVDSVLEGSAVAWQGPARRGAGGVRAQQEIDSEDDIVVVTVVPPTLVVTPAPTCAFSEPVWKDGRTDLALTGEDKPFPSFNAEIGVDAEHDGDCTLSVVVGGDLNGVTASINKGGASTSVRGKGTLDLGIDLPDDLPVGTFEIPVTITLDPGEGDSAANTSGSAGAADGDGRVSLTATLRVKVDEAKAHVRISGDGSATKKIEKYSKSDAPVEWPNVTVTLDERDAADGRSVLVEWTCARFTEGGGSPDCRSASGKYSEVLDKNTRSVEVPFAAPPAPFRGLAEGEYPGELIIDLDSGGAALSVDGPKNVDLRGSRATLTYEPTARVYVSFLNKHGRNLLIGLLAALSVGLLYLARPGLPRDAAINHAGGISPISSGGFIGPGGVDIGASETVGQLKGRWFGTRTGSAILVPSQLVELNGEEFEAGQKVKLALDDTITVPNEGVSFDYLRESVDGGDGYDEGFDDGYGD